MFAAPKELRESRNTLSRLKNPDNFNAHESVHGLFNLYNKYLNVQRREIHAKISRGLSEHSK